MALLHETPTAAAPTRWRASRRSSAREGRMASTTSTSCACPAPGTARCASSRSRRARSASSRSRTHLEAGHDRVPRRGRRASGLRFEIESWARSGDRLSNLLYHHLRMAKEIQLHMWTSFIERVARASGGRLTGGIDIHTRRVERRRRWRLTGCSAIQREPRSLADLARPPLNFDPARLARARAPTSTGTTTTTASRCRPSRRASPCPAAASRSRGG